MAPATCFQIWSHLALWTRGGYPVSLPAQLCSLPGGFKTAFSVLFFSAKGMGKCFQREKPLKAPWPGATSPLGGLTCLGALGQQMSGDFPAGTCAGTTSILCQGVWGSGVSAQTTAKTTTYSLIIAIVQRHEPASTASLQLTNMQCCCVIA